jgi:hypothetical protein
MAEGNNNKSLEDLMEQYADEEKQLFELAKTSEKAEFFPDMCAFMKRLLEVKKNKADAKGEKVKLSDHERNQLSIAYKNVVGQRRGSWRTISSSSHTEMATPGELQMKYQKIIEAELEKWCREVLGLIKNILLPSDAEIEIMKKSLDEMTEDEKKQFPETDKESTIFYLKMCGDYYRYLAEFMDTDEVKNNAAGSYDKAVEIAKVCLPPTHPTRLGLVLNASVCKYEIMKDHEAAQKLAKEGFDSAIQKLDSLNDMNYKDSTLIMQLLRDNLTIWTSGDDTQEDRED